MGWRRNLLLMVGSGVGYYVLLYPSNLFWHPPAGLRFAFLALLPVRLWIWPIAGELVAFVIRGIGADSAGGFPFALFIFAVHRLLALSGPLYLHRSPRPLRDGSPESLAHLLAIMLLTSIICAPVAMWWFFPKLGTAIPAMPMSIFALNIVLGDYIGMLLIVPAALMIFRYKPSITILRAWLYDIPIVLAPSLTLYALVALNASTQAYFFATMLCVLPVIHFAFRTGWRGVAIALPAASVAVAVCSSASVNVATAQAQFLLAFAGSACLLLGGANDSLRFSRDELRSQNAQLVLSNRKLNKATDDLREAARRNLSLSEETRRWITSELHDELGQSLTALQVRLKLAERGSPASELFLPIWGIVNGMRTSVSRLMANLRPAGLEDFGFEQSIERGPIRELLDTSGLNFSCRFDDRGEILDGLDTDMQIALYRVIQEAATNTVRHGNAHSFFVIVRTRVSTSRCRTVLLVVGDDGDGMPSNPRNGVGLLSIRDRVLSLGGRLRYMAPRRGMLLLARFSAVADSR